MSAPWWIIILILAALFFLILDLLIPSGGALLLVSIVSAIAAIVIAFQYDYYWGMGTLTLLFAATPWLLFLAIKIWPKTIIGQLMIRARPDSLEEVMPDTDQIRELKSLVGEVGQTETNFMPSGTIIVRGKRFDANSRGGYIARGTVVEVIATQLGHLVIAPCDPARLELLQAASETSSPTVEPSQNILPESAAATLPVQPKSLNWSLADEQLLDETLDQSLEGIDLSSSDDQKR